MSSIITQNEETLQKSTRRVSDFCVSLACIRFERFIALRVFLVHLFRRFLFFFHVFITLSKNINQNQNLGNSIFPRWLFSHRRSESPSLLVHLIRHEKIPMLFWVILMMNVWMRNYLIFTNQFRKCPSATTEITQFSFGISSCKSFEVDINLLSVFSNQQKIFHLSQLFPCYRSLLFSSFAWIVVDPI